MENMKINNELYDYIYKCVDLLEKLNYLSIQADRAVMTEEEGYAGNREYLGKNYLSFIDKIKEHISNIKNGLANIQPEVEKLNNMTIDFYTRYQNFPKIKSTVSNFRNEVKHYECLTKEHKDLINKMKNINQMFNTDADLVSVKYWIDCLIESLSKIVNEVNKYSVSLGNEDVLEEINNKKQRDEFISQYVKDYYKYHCELGLFDRLKNKELMNQKLENAKEVFDTKNKREEKDDLTLIEIIKNPTRENVLKLRDNISLYLDILYLTANGKYLRKGKEAKLNRRQVNNAANLFTVVEFQRRLQKDNRSYEIRKKLFETPQKYSQMVK